MKFASALLLAVAATASTASSTRAPDPRFALLPAIAGPDGSYDYASVDADANRIYVGRRYGVMMVDLSTGRSRTLIERDGVAAALVLPGTPLLLTTNSRANSATLVDRTTGIVAADLPTGQGPDGAYYDAATATAFVMNGDGRDVTMIDVARRRAEGSIPLDGAPEGAVTDGQGHLFVNIEDGNRIAMVDIGKRALVRSYALADCDEPTGITHDPVTNLLISACHNGVAKLIDAATGRDRGTIAIGKGADGSLFDAASRIGFIPCLDGTTTIYRLSRDGRAQVVQTLKTREGARTAAFDAVRGRLYLPFATVERDAKGEYLRAKKGFGILVAARR